MFSSLITINIQASRHDALDMVIRISKNKGTIYELLKDLSEQSGYLFIYDSQIIDNDKKVKIKKGEYPLRDAIYLITGNNRLQIDLSGAYLLLRLVETHIPANTNDSASNPAQDIYFTIKGLLFDQETKESILYASVSILNTSIGTITNQEGGFQLVIPDSLQNHKARFSHIGYESQEIDLALLKGKTIDLGLRPQTVALQEVVVSTVNPEQALNDMLNSRAANYASEPAYLTTFYREGIDHNDRNIDLTESVLQVYKTGYNKNVANDQVKLIKKRRILSKTEIDTIFPKMRSGIKSCLILDIIKELPEFTIPDEETPYTYSYKGKSFVDNRPVNIIFFQQKKHVQEPLYVGDLYIEAGNKALIEVRFEINSRLADRATHAFIDKKTAGLKINLQQAQYIVSYKPSEDGRYYVNHVRGDLRFKIRQKKRLFSSSLHFWFEMATCDIRTKEIKPFPLNERLSTTQIFAETKHTCDKDFWKNFNIILPEDDLKNSIIHNLHEVLITEQ
jgi:hypothetical protein